MLLLTVTAAMLNQAVFRLGLFFRRSKKAFEAIKEEGDYDEEEEIKRIVIQQIDDNGKIINPRVDI